MFSIEWLYMTDIDFSNPSISSCWIIKKKIYIYLVWITNIISIIIGSDNKRSQICQFNLSRVWINIKIGTIFNPITRMWRFCQFYDKYCLQKLSKFKCAHSTKYKEPKRHVLCLIALHDSCLILITTYTIT